ncbi:MAG: S8 family serine peptidase [Thermoanaerobaculia bacterium]|nr:S8 family serine peptidase [Thermoanaerobaculia bacterium]
MRSRILCGLAAALLLVSLAVPLAAAPSGEASRFVRVPAAESRALSSLGLAPRFTASYEGFRWLELAEADYQRLVSARLPFVEDVEAGTVQIVRYRFDPLAEGEPALGPGESAAATGPGFHLVQFRGPVADAWLAELAKAGLEPLQYYPHHAYLVWGDARSTESTAALPFVRWQGRVHPAYKPAPSLDGREGIVRNVDVMFFGEERVEETLAAIEKLGGRVLHHYPAQPDRKLFDAIVELPAEAVAAVSQIPNVLWLGFQGPRPILDDEMSSQIQAGNHPGGVPVTGYFSHLTTLGVDGTGVIWAIVDTGVDYDHPDLGSHIVGGYDFPGACSFAGQPGSDCSGGGHGTHVAGIVGGDATGAFTDANGFLYGLGVAPGVSFFAMNSLSASAWPPTGGWQEHSKRAVLGNAIGGNNSWTTGEGTQHGYQASERTHDIMVRDGNFDTTTVAEPFIEVFSAGNSGSSGLTAPKEAKNLIVTASSMNYRVGSIENISSFSSRGPAVDGRQVPTITAPGEQIASSRNDLGGDCSTSIGGTNNLYAYCSGTSMASPHAAGAVVLLTDWWRGFNAGLDPSPAMAKALLVNNAVDMGGSTAARWNNAEGWGRIHVTNIVQPGVPVEYWDQDNLLINTGQSFQVTVGVANPALPVKVTLAWSDAPGAVGANPALVNNLDLTVVDGASTYLGNVFSGGWSATGGAADNRNNLENVFIQSPTGGAIDITVAATNIAGDGVPYNGDPTDQDYALVCTNCALQADFTLGVSPQSQAVCAPGDAAFAVSVGQILAFTDNVTLGVTGHPAGTTTGFSVNPVTPPGSSVLTIGNTGAAAAGSYLLDVTGTSTTGTKTRQVSLDLFNLPPGAPTPTSPAPGAINQPLRPAFTWDTVAQAGSYRLQVATDPAFGNLVMDETGIAGTTFTPGSDLASNTVHHWRVRGENACGNGAWSTASSFTTVPLPGDCPLGAQPVAVYSYGFEAGASGWTTPSGVGTNTWAITTTNPYDGANHYRGAGTASVTDQRLVSPAVAVPSGQDPVVLRFWHAPNLESSGTTECWDGGILEISTDAGATWTQVPNADLLLGGYERTIRTSTNPLGGLPGWCGPNPSPYQQTIADLSAYAGQSVQLRWRIGTDGSVSRPGWDVDAVVVQACTFDLIFSDGFEGGSTLNWSATQQ